MFNDNEITNIQNEITKKGYFVYKNDATVDLARRARDEFFSSFRSYKKANQGFTYSDLADGPLIKKNISSTNGVGESYAQVLQSAYYPAKTSLPAIDQVFQRIIVTRNQLTGQAKTFGDNPVQDRFWDARRIHHYPQGGGFMFPHRDSYFPTVLNDVQFLQVLFLLSEKGQDFQSGGGYIYDLQDQKIDLETEGGLGAIIYFDGRIIHGVADVDAQEDFDLTRPTGRLSAIANLYEYRD